MDARELFGRIKRLPVMAEGLATDMLAGGFRSVFKGQGMEFDEARHYLWGDDAKSIDWNASTRLGTPFVKVYREEREVSVTLLLDVSASMRGGIARPWGSDPGDGDRVLSPFEQAVIACALLAFSAEKSGQRVGAVFFDRGVERVFPARKGRGNALAIVAAALGRHSRAPAQGPPGEGPGSDVGAAIEAAGALLKRRGLVALVSDFLSVGWERGLGALARRHDVVAVRVHDPGESDLPDLGLLSIADPETGERVSAPTGFPSFREAWETWHGDRADLWRKLCRRAGAATLELPVTADAAAELGRFFGSRGSRG